MFTLRKFSLILKVIAAATFVYLIIFDPFGELASKLIVLAAFMGMGVWGGLSALAKTDEVELAATKTSGAIAALVGCVGAFLFVILMRISPSISLLISDLADHATNNLPSAAVGFAFGVMFTFFAVIISFLIARALWWASKLSAPPAE